MFGASGRQQTATYWAPVGPDGYGQYSFVGSVPTLLAVRWQDDAQLFRDTNGKEVVSIALVYPESPVAVRGFLALGDFTGTPDPRDLPQAHEIQQVSATVALDNSDNFVKAYL